MISLTQKRYDAKSKTAFVLILIKKKIFSDGFSCLYPGLRVKIKHLLKKKVSKINDTIMMELHASRRRRRRRGASL